MYAELQEAFGEDVAALWNHYQTDGASEGRGPKYAETVFAKQETVGQETESKNQPTPEYTSKQQQVVTDEWAVGLYNALVVDDYRKVIELIGDISNTREKCRPYIDEEWSTWQGETAYSMLMEDGAYSYVKDGNEVGLR